MITQPLKLDQMELTTLMQLPLLMTTLQGIDGTRQLV